MIIVKINQLCYMDYIQPLFQSMRTSSAVN